MMNMMLSMNNKEKEFHKTDKLYKQSTFTLKREA